MLNNSILELAMIEQAAIAEQYKAYNISVGLQLVKYIPELNRRIYKVNADSGTKIQNIFERSEDISYQLKIPFYYVYREGTDIFLVVSKNNDISTDLLDLLRTEEYVSFQGTLPLVLGWRVDCKPYIGNLEELRHLLIIGCSGAGKSVLLQDIVLGIMMKKNVDQVNFIIIDAANRFSKPFRGSSYLSTDIAENVIDALNVLKALLAEMNRRVSLSIDELNKCPALVCVIDEYFRLINDPSYKNECDEIVENVRVLLSMSRNAKIHLILTSQSADAATLKGNYGNITSRICFWCKSYSFSYQALGIIGAEKIGNWGKGAFMFRSDEYPEGLCLKEAYPPKEDIGSLVSEISMYRSQYSQKFELNIPQTTEGKSKMEHIAESEIAKEKTIKPTDDEKLLSDMIFYVLGYKYMTRENIKKQFHIGNISKDLMEELTSLKIISPKNGNQKRMVIISNSDDLEKTVLDLMNLCNYTKDEIDERISNRIEHPNQD